MSRLLAIDPGSEKSAYVLMDMDTYMPVRKGIVDNEELKELHIPEMRLMARHMAIEMVASYGMPVGKEIFETCVWIGRLIETWEHFGGTWSYVYRMDEKRAICHSSRANDATIRQALMDRFGDKGTKKAPGWFYKFKADMWQAYAVGVTYIDQRKE